MFIDVNAYLLFYFIYYPKCYINNINALHTTQKKSLHISYSLLRLGVIMSMKYAMIFFYRNVNKFKLEPAVDGFVKLCF